MTHRFQIVAALAVVCLFTGSSLANAQGAMNRPAIEKALMDNERKINEAVKQNDAATFKSLVLEEGWSIDMGGLSSVKDFIPVMGDLKITDMALADFKVLWVTDDAAILTYMWTGKGTFKGQPIPEKVMASTTWVNRNGKWSAIFHTETTVMPM